MTNELAHGAPAGTPSGPSGRHPAPWCGWMAMPGPAAITITLLVLILAAWASATGAPANDGPGSLAWLVRAEGLNLTGLGAIALMSVAMLLATRPAWLERPLGGLDRSYRLHKWLGIGGVLLAASHWLVEMSDDIIKGLWGRAGRPEKVRFDGVLESMRDLAEEFGEWAIYALLAMLAITLWKRFPYKFWRHAHRAMPVLYLMLAFHAALLAPPRYWSQPVGWLLGLMLVVGSASAVWSLSGRTGRSRQVQVRIASARQMDGVTSLVCEVPAGHATQWRGHAPGQFAFLSFDAVEGAHPFTIASADRGDGRIGFEIKALGDFTRTLGQSVRPGQTVQLEGPYGCFRADRIDPRAQQRWIAAGIGITPFLAWLDGFNAQPGSTPKAELHYIVADAGRDPLMQRAQALCASLPGVTLVVHDSARDGRPTPEAVLAGLTARGRAEIWYCGPETLAESLERAAAKRGQWRMHRELFSMR